MAIIHTNQRSLYISASKYIVLAFAVAIAGRLLVQVNVLITIATLIAFPVIAGFGTKFLIGAIGEWKVTRVIKKFNDSYNLFNDIKIPNNQIDHILVCPKGVYTIETKTYLRNIYGSENSKFLNQYFRGKKYNVKNPVFQGKRHSVALSDLLKEKGMNIFIKTIVVFAGQARIKVNWRNIPMIYYSKLYDYLSKQRDVLSQDEIQNYTNQIISITKN